MKKIIPAVVVLVLAIAFFYPKSYISSPGHVTAEMNAQFEKTAAKCTGFERLTNAEAVAADAPGKSLCFGWLKKATTPVPVVEELPVTPQVEEKKPAPKITPISTSMSLPYNIMQVPEMGINLPILKTIKDFKYSVKNNKLYFSRTSFEQQSPACLVKQGPFGYLEKIMKVDLISDPNGEWTETVEGIERAKKNGVVKEFDKFYIVYVTPQDPTCATAVGAKGLEFSLQGITLIK